MQNCDFAADNDQLIVNVSEIWFVYDPCSASPCPDLCFCLSPDPQNETSSCRIVFLNLLLHCAAVTVSQIVAESEIETWSSGCPGPCRHGNDDSDENVRMSVTNGVMRSERKMMKDWKKTVFG